ncbi:hypothetical protein EDD11_001975 [Mortierella claussenii]|nr:hypothetical protein EDD11_001975 [Mortierella claussenii]
MNKAKVSSNDVIIIVSEKASASGSKDAVPKAIPYQKHRAVATLKNKGCIEIICFMTSGGFPRVEVNPLTDNVNLFEGFDYLSLLDEDNKVMTLNLVGKKTSTCGLGVNVERGTILKGGLYDFKLLLKAATSTLYLPGKLYPAPSGVRIITASTTIDKELIPSEVKMEETRLANLRAVRKQTWYSGAALGGHSNPPQKTPISSINPKPVAPLATNQATVNASAVDVGSAPHSLSEDAVQPPVIRRTDHRDMSFPQVVQPPSTVVTPILISSEPRFQSLAPRRNSSGYVSGTSSSDQHHGAGVHDHDTPAKDCAYDVHFYHYDPVRGINNLIGAHRAYLQAFPKLSHHVDKTESARKSLADGMNLRISDSELSPWSTLATTAPSYIITGSPSPRSPVTVDISYLPFTAFKALITYVYTRDVKAILSNVSALAATSSSPPSPLPGSVHNPTGSTSTSSSVPTEESANRAVVMDPASTLCIDELLLLAHRFDVRELFEVCVELIHLTLNVRTAVPILVHLGSEFEEIKRPVMLFIRNHFQEIFGGQDDEYLDPFAPFRSERHLYHGCSFELMTEILRMMARVKHSSVEASAAAATAAAATAVVAAAATTGGTPASVSVTDSTVPVLVDPTVAAAIFSVPAPSSASASLSASLAGSSSSSVSASASVSASSSAHASASSSVFGPTLTSTSISLAGAASVSDPDSPRPNAAVVNSTSSYWGS